MSSDPLSFCDERLRALDAGALRRRVRSLSSAQDPEVILDGRTLVHLASNNYLGLANDPRVIEAAASAARRFGAGAASARLISGGTDLHDDLEHALASFKHTEAALLFSSGYLANLGTIAALAGPGDVIVSDALNHASIIDGARLSRATVAVYGHGDADHASALLREHAGARRRLLVTDSVFSMDGDLAPLTALAEACARTSSMLMVDEAHASGVVGPNGAGAVALLGLEGAVHVIMGTLSKALGSAGGYIAGSHRLIDYLRNTARTFIFDTALPAPAAGAARAALDVIAREPDRVARARANAATLSEGLRARGYRVSVPRAAIIPVPVGSAEGALSLAASLEQNGVLAPAIRPPSVAEGASRVRVTVMATHTPEQIARALDAFAAVAAAGART